MGHILSKRYHKHCPRNRRGTEDIIVCFKRKIAFIHVLEPIVPYYSQKKLELIAIKLCTTKVHVHAF
jgi:hypothetical protein